MGHALDPRLPVIVGVGQITIRDESSKVNLNVAGGHSYDPIGPVVNDLQTSPRLGGLINTGYYRALGQGATSAEFETRTLPGVGVVEAAQMWVAPRALLASAMTFAYGWAARSFTPAGSVVWTVFA